MTAYWKEWFPSKESDTNPVYPKLCAAKVLCFDKTLYFSS